MIAIPLPTQHHYRGYPLLLGKRMLKSRTLTKKKRINMTIGLIILSTVLMAFTIAWTLTKVAVRTTAFVFGAGDNVKDDLAKADRTIDSIVKKIKE